MSTATIQDRVTLQGVPTAPQVNLLPPEVRAGRTLSKVKAWLGVALLGLLLVLGLLYVWASFDAKQAESQLADVQAQNQALLAEQAQYAEVPEVLRDIADLTEARTFGLQSETLWQPYLAAIAAVTPTEVSLDDVSVSQQTPWGTPATVITGSPLATAGTVGTVTMTGRSETVPDTSTWEDGLETIPGLVDVEISAIQLSSEGEDPYYAVTATMSLTVDAYANRFSGEES